MTKGYPDWQPTSAGAALAIVFNTALGAAEVIIVPAVAGQVIVLHGVIFNNRAAGTSVCDLIEKTAAGVEVRRFLRILLANAGVFTFDFGGAVLGVGNRLDAAASAGTGAVTLVHGRAAG